MISATKEAMQKRQASLKNWLYTDCGFSSFSLQAMQGDASFRRYFRVQTKERSFVLMDAPVDSCNCQSFIAIANALRRLGLKTPEIFQADVAQGLLLLTDFGEVTYLKALQTDNADFLYKIALDALSVMQTCDIVPNHPLPLFSGDLMWQEWSACKEWFFEKWLGLNFKKAEKKLDDCFLKLVAAIVSQPQVFMHRDYHSANLMVLQDQAVGILDFQDAFKGPITYDLVSLLRDCYIAWPREKVTEWVGYFWQQLQEKGQLRGVTQQTFLRWFDLMGIERHLKALFTFSRKAIRDHETRYLHAVPRTLQYLLTASAAHTECLFLSEYLKDTVIPAVEAKGVI